MLIKVWHLLEPNEKLRAAFVFCCILLQGLAETLSLGAVVPLLALLARPEEALKNEWVARAHILLGSPEMPRFIAIACIGVFALFILKNLYVLASDVMQARFCLSLQRRLSTELLAGYLGRDYPFFFRHNTSILLRNVINEVTSIAQGVLLYGLILLSELATVAGVLTLMLFANPSLSFALGCGAALVISGIYFFIRRPARRVGEVNQRTTNQLFKLASEALQGVKDVKVLGRAPYFTGKYRVIAEENAAAVAKSRVLSGMPRLVLESAAIGGIATVVFYAQATGVALETLVPMLGLYALSAYRLMPSAGRILSALSQFRYSSPSVEVVHSALIEGRANSNPPAGGAVAMPFHDALEFREVSFSFGGGRDALKKVSFRLERGKSLGLVGSSGAGKSTLADLVLGLLNPGSGQILIDGVPLVRDKIHSWQKSLGYVPQQIFLSDDSLRRNVAFGVDDAEIDEAKVQKAISLARLDELIRELPQGLDTRVGEKGIQISGGQRQRVGIARALYHDPEVLVLDEATSALDTVTEAQFSEAVKGLSGTKTLLIIAHRLSTVKDCDSILLLDQGEVRAQGSYSELLGKSPEFRALASHQTREASHG